MLIEIYNHHWISVMYYQRVLDINATFLLYFNISGRRLMDATLLWNWDIFLPSSQQHFSSIGHSAIGPNLTPPYYYSSLKFLNSNINIEQVLTHFSKSTVKWSLENVWLWIFSNYESYVLHKWSWKSLFSLSGSR